MDTQDLLLGVIYNPPSRSQRHFFDEFEKVLHFVKAKVSDQLGDFINILALFFLFYFLFYYFATHNELQAE